MKNTLLLVITAGMVLCVTGNSWAHRYIPNEGAHNDAATAIPIGDINVSQVVYHTVAPDRQTVWLSFEGKKGDVAKIQLGVPYIKGLEAYRPAFALLGQELPAVEDIPFEIPQGYGGIIYTTDHITDPEIFDEEFTGTESWVFEMQEIILPADGLYYIVGYVPAGNLGKFWVAPGTLEKFGAKDIVTLPWIIYQVRTFHQIFPFGGILFWAMVILLALIGGVLLIVQPFGILSSLS